jgi:oxygen-independent coproporphyrinogen-3 oxidase
MFLDTLVTLPFLTGMKLTYIWNLDRKKSFIESTTKVLVYTFICRFVKHVYFCGCNKRKKNHDVEHPYLEAVIKEWSLLQIIDENPLSKKFI